MARLSSTDTLVARIDADIARLQELRAYVLETPETASAPPKPRKPRTKRGPSEANDTGE